MIRVLTYPGKKEDDNPHLYLVYKEASALGIRVRPPSLQRILREKVHVWQLHWPERRLAVDSFSRALSNVLLFLMTIDLARARGVKILYTLHNLSSHELCYPRLEKWFMKALTRRLDGYVTFTETGMKAFEERVPVRKDIPAFVIPRGHYRGAYPDRITPREARATLGIPSEAKVVLFFGLIRSYKGVPQLVRAFREISDPEALLCVVGQPYTPALEQAVVSEASDDPRVRLHLRFVPDHDVQLYFRAADLVVLPFRQVLNSGSAMLALSFDRPLLVPLLGALGELREQVGDEWVRTYKEEEITPRHIEEALNWALNTTRPNRAPLEVFDPNGYAKRLVNAYRSVAVTCAEGSKADARLRSRIQVLLLSRILLLSRKRHGQKHRLKYPRRLKRKAVRLGRRTTRKIIRLGRRTTYRLIMKLRQG